MRAVFIISPNSDDLSSGWVWLQFHRAHEQSIHNTWQRVQTGLATLGLVDEGWCSSGNTVEMPPLLPKQCKCLLEMKSSPFMCSVLHVLIFIFVPSVSSNLWMPVLEKVCLCVLALSPKCWTMSQLCSVAVWNKCWNTLWASEQALYIVTTCPVDQ